MQNKNITIVTGLWDLGRGDLEGWSKRSFETYKTHFFKLLETDAQFCIFIPKELEEEVREIRGDKPTAIYIKELKDIETWNPFFNEIQKIREDEKWSTSVGWLTDSPQAKLKYYNALMMCKMFMVNDASVYNPFKSEYFYWIDGGLTSTVNPGYFINDKVLDNLENYSRSIEKFTFLQYPYEGNTEVHGFERKKLAQFCDTEYVNKISRGGFFGGHKEILSQLNGHYYNFLSSTLTQGYMGADECLFTILSYRYPELIHNFALEGNGLVFPFFENLKQYDKVRNDLQKDTVLYVITYNSPKQFETIIESFKQYDPDLLKLTDKVLLDNSMDPTTFDRYKELCEEYDFKHIKKDNIGICGGRQFIAEHFDKETNGKQYLFFEDDMFFYNGKETTCRNGFNRKVKNILNKSIQILNRENFDFLKYNFSEFYGEHSKQWAWYNVPQNLRDKFWPDYNKLPERGLDPHSPFLEFSNIKIYKRIPYITGEIYYSNWPQLVSRAGNRKMFLETKWDRPFEQTWMSHFFQLTKEKKLKPGLLLITPTEHDRFDFYPAEERREN